jgi:hypothetical protein
MDAELLIVSSDDETTAALSWATTVRDRFIDISPVYRPSTAPLSEPCALTGPVAIGVRTDDLSTIEDFGFDFLVDTTIPDVDPTFFDLVRTIPEHLMSVWDTPTTPLELRYDMSGYYPRFASSDALTLRVCNHVRLDALVDPVRLYLVDSALESEFEVAVLAPGWAVLHELARYAEVDVLLRNGLIDAAIVRDQFATTAATAIRAMRAFPDVALETFVHVTNGDIMNMSGVEQSAGALDYPRPWSAHVRPMAERFFADVQRRPYALVGLNDGTEHVREAFTALTDLSIALGLPNTRPFEHVFGDEPGPGHEFGRS